MCTCTCKCLCVATCVYLCLYTGVHERVRERVHVATSPGNDAILSSYIFLLGRGFQYRHVMPAMRQPWMINDAAMCLWTGHT